MSGIDQAQSNRAMQQVGESMFFELAISLSRCDRHFVIALCCVG